MIARGAASVPWLLYKCERELDAHPLLALLDRPNPRQSGAALIESLIGYPSSSEASASKRAARIWARARVNAA